MVTAVEVGHGKRKHLLSDYTFAVRRSEDDGELLNIGKAYSGLTDAELTEMTAWFTEHTVQQFGHGRVRLVEPAVVIEVTFDRVQPSKRHKSGYALRFPRILRLRPDKNPAGDRYAGNGPQTCRREYELILNLSGRRIKSILRGAVRSTSSCFPVGYEGSIRLVTVRLPGMQDTRQVLLAKSIDSNQFEITLFDSA